MTADVRQLMQLSRSLASGGVRAGLDVRAVVARGAHNIKQDWRANARQSAGRHARRYPDSITYDLTVYPTGARAEIGPDKSLPQGPLGNLLEFGSRNNPPHFDGLRALQAETPRFLAQLALVASRAVR